MTSTLNVAIHRSQFPAAVTRDLLASLRSRQVKHKFHYDSIKQTQKWLALHQAYSPSRTDPECARVYDSAFQRAALSIKAHRVHLLGLGCGGGQKDTRVLKLLRDGGKDVSYMPSDVSTAMVLVASEAASQVIPSTNCFPLVCDLETADDLPEVIVQLSGSRRGNEADSSSEMRPVPPRYLGGYNSEMLITCFGMMPNFESHLFLPRLAGFMKPSDILLLSANLSPGSDYDAGLQRILPLYDNELTRHWLMTFLLDLGVESGDGDLRFCVEADPDAGQAKRVAAYFHFTRSRQIQLEEEQVAFRESEAIRLFFSYRHTPELIRDLLEPFQLRVIEQWVTPSQEEGVFLIQNS